MRSMILDKFKASAIHLTISAIIIGVFLFLVYSIWYPYPLYVTEGLSEITIILLGVDLVLGPIMTLILYRKDKKYLLLDLSIIIIIQFSAFVYGVNSIAEGRPVYLVFATDVFKTVSPNMIDINTLKDSTLRYSLFSKPIYIYATAPKDPKKRTRLMWSTLSGGKDIEQLPEYYQSYNKNIDKVMSKQFRYNNFLKKHPDLQNILISTLHKYKLTQANSALFLLLGKKKETFVIIDLATGHIIDFINPAVL